MSSVLSRFRGISSMEFYRCCTELRTVLMGALMNENIMPKRWRPIFTFPISAMLDDLFGHLIAANGVYTNTPENVAERKRYQRFALNDLERIDDKIQQILTQLYYGKIDADHPMPAELEKAGDLIDRADMLIRAWRRSTKLITQDSSKSSAT
jgi:hypothetical protein